jgi:cold shock CspA family protein
MESRDFPIQITFHGVDHSDALEEAARAHVAHLNRFHGRIHGCRVVIGKAEGAARAIKYHVQLRVEIPGNDVVCGSSPARPEHADPLVALGDAFKTAERQLDEGQRVRRGQVKARAEGLLEGRVTRLAEDGDHGFIETVDGREVYFHRNSVLGGGFDDLEPGAPVRFAEEDGLQGPQASTVRVA